MMNRSIKISCCFVLVSLSGCHPATVNSSVNTEKRFRLIVSVEGILFAVVIISKIDD